MQQATPVLVTGAGVGISGASVLDLVGRCLDVFACVGDLDAGPAPAGRYPRITAVERDITAEEAVGNAPEVLPERHAVVSNAGIAVEDPVHAVALDDVRRLVEDGGVDQVTGVAAQDAP